MRRASLLAVAAATAILLLVGIDRCWSGVEFQDPPDPVRALRGHRLAWAYVFSLAGLCGVGLRRRPAVAVLAFLVLLEAPFAVMATLHPRALQSHPRRGLEPVPGYSRPPIVQHNSRGLRGPEVESPKRGFRIVVLGDSTLYGAGVSDEETAARRLEKSLGMEVVNAAAPGTASADGVWLLEGRLRDLQPDLLIVGYNNDASPSPVPDRQAYAPGLAPDLLAWAMDRSALIRFLVESGIVARGRQQGGPPRATPEEFEANLRRLAGLAPRVVLIDMPEDVEALAPGSAGKLPSEYRARLRQVGVPVYEARSSWEPGHPERFWADHYHLTAEGHRVLAEGLLEALATSGATSPGRSAGTPPSPP